MQLQLSRIISLLLTSTTVHALAFPSTTGNSNAKCPTNTGPGQQPIANNICNSGSPYCCSGSGAGKVCGPASTTTCTSTTICCINTDGVSIFSVARHRILQLTDPLQMQICA